MALNQAVTSGFSASLHGLRGLAALAVVLFHWYQIFPALSRQIEPLFPEGSVLNPVSYFGFGWLGVPLFFVLSGYLLGSKVIDQRLNRAFITRFWRRRLLRIYPAVWFHLLVLLALAPHIAGLVKPEMWDSLGLQFLLWINMPPQMQAPISNVLWTLPIELSFYLLLPFLGAISRRVQWVVVLVGALFITLGWRAYWLLSQDLNNYVVLLPYLDMLPGTLFTFMAGYSLNFLHPVASPLVRRACLILSFTGFIALLQWQLLFNEVYWTGHWILAVWPPCVALTIAAMVYFIDQPSMPVRWLGHPIMVWLGNISFGVYLWHYPIMRAMKLSAPDLWLSPLLSFVALPAALLLALPIATLSYRFIERPLMGWHNAPEQSL